MEEGKEREREVGRTALILASRSLVITPLEISSSKGCCWVFKCSWNSASHLTMSSTATGSRRPLTPCWKEKRERGRSQRRVPSDENARKREREREGRTA